MIFYFEQLNEEKTKRSYKHTEIQRIHERCGKISGNEISLWLDSYDDIYSDFDSRNYLKRRVSEDFVDELKTALMFDDESPDLLILSVPVHLRKKEIEG